METNKIKESIHSFVATHQCIVTRKAKERDEDLRVTFTNWGDSSACKALFEVISICDEATQKRIVEMMDNRRVN